MGRLCLSSWKTWYAVDNCRYAVKRECTKDHTVTLTTATSHIQGWKTWKKIRYADRLTQRKSEWRKRTDQPLFIPLYSYCFPKCRATLSAIAFFRSWLRVFDKEAVVLWMRSCRVMPCLITSEGTRPSVPVLILACVLLQRPVWTRDIRNVSHNTIAERDYRSIF